MNILWQGAFRLVCLENEALMWKNPMANIQFLAKGSLRPAHSWSSSWQVVCIRSSWDTPAHQRPRPSLQKQSQVRDCLQQFKQHQHPSLDLGEFKHRKNTVRAIESALPDTIMGGNDNINPYRVVLYHCFTNIIIMNQYYRSFTGMFTNIPTVL